ncbi:hypothetical protein GIB67_015390 [Kingdonia uniflora]|uniref:Uncharacterized protein n=1 Tax=Kingdonia uniflora TaxID=39325 RepID=A0A7J7KYX1_9MAGN|nr:hypothetical protein GIB67_015390 [Kingdonia uniflora]
MLVGCSWRIGAHGVILSADLIDMCHSVALGDNFYNVAIYDIVDGNALLFRPNSNIKRLLVMQDNYGASGYFLEIGGTNKRKHVETLKLTEVSTSDKLESFHASQEFLEGKKPELHASRQPGLLDFIVFALPVSHTSKPEACQGTYVLPSNFEEATTRVLKAFNNLVLLDITLLEGMMVIDEMLRLGGIAIWLMRKEK